MLLRLLLRGSRIWERVFFVGSLGASGAAYRCAAAAQRGTPRLGPATQHCSPRGAARDARFTPLT